ncbi:hypothetical protein P3S67_013787 [Capsicum chacoense]
MGKMNMRRALCIQRSSEAQNRKMGDSGATSTSSNLIPSQAIPSASKSRTEGNSSEKDANHDLINFPTNDPLQNGQVESLAVVMPSDNQAKRSDWQEWADQLINDDDDGGLCSSWNDILVDISPPEIKFLETSEILACESRILPSPAAVVAAASSGQSYLVGSPSSITALTKPRMRWTPELHEVFVEAVSKLGGSEKATPKGVLKITNVEGLTIYHVKRHLQKYRTARYKPEPSEDKKVEDFFSFVTDSQNDIGIFGNRTMGITEALRLQMEVQKQLHEQLEIQRKLQLWIEEQGKYLEMMFERTKEIGKDFKVSSSVNDEHPSPSTEPKHSPPNDKSEALEKDLVNLNDRSITGQESS